MADLVIQGPGVTASHVEEIARLCAAAHLAQVGPQAFRLRGAQENVRLGPYCERAGIDWAFVPERLRLADFGLLVMDMDSTLIAIECIDEIADLAGIKPQVAQITAAAMGGEIEFAESLKRRIALLRDLPESALARVYDERLKLNPGAEQLLAQAKAKGLKTLLVSGGFTYFTDRLKERLAFDYCAANRLEIAQGRVTGRVLGKIVDAEGKAAALVRVRARLKLARKQVIAVGDGANDLKMMAEAGMSIAYHAKPVVRAHATYQIDHGGLDSILNFFSDVP